MNEIDIISTIKRENLDERNYFKSLIDILNSNIYTISIYLKTFRNPDEAIQSIKKQVSIYCMDILTIIKN